MEAIVDHDYRSTAAGFGGSEEDLTGRERG